MSFNQISGKNHGRQLLIKRTQRPNSHNKTIPHQQQIIMTSENESFRDGSINDESPIKKESIFSLPSIRRESLGKIEKINLQNVSKNKNFFNEVYLQQNYGEEKALSPVMESRFSIKMPKKLSLNRSQQRAIEQQQSIIYNYLNEKVRIKKPKKKKKKKILSKSAQKQQKSDRLYVFPSSDPRIHRRQKTEFKITKSQRMDLGSILQKRRSLDSSSQHQNFQIIKRQHETIHQQARLLEELKKRVNEVERHQKSINKLSLNKIPFQLLNKKYSFSNKTIENDTLSIEQRNKPDDPYHEQPKSSLALQIPHNEQDVLNRTNRTIEKTPKNLKFSMQRKQSSRKIAASNMVPFFQKNSQLQKEQDLADTIKYNDERSQDPASEPSQKDSSQSPQDSKLKEGRIQDQSSDDQQKKAKIQIPYPTPSDQIQPEVLKQKQTISPKTNRTQPSRFPDKSFLSIKTYYAQFSTNPKISTRQMSFINISTQSLISKQIPSKQQITQFIENYILQNKTISIRKLISSQNFEVILQENQELYFGQMVKNLKSGIGVTIRHNYLYEGHYSNGQKIKGLEVTQNGTYFGEFKNNKKQGQGKFEWKNGEMYDGQWLNGKKHGHGAWSSPNGDTYVGQWVNGKVHGQGVHKSKSGQNYEGSFHQFLKSGWGKQQLPNGDFYEGQFLNGKPNGSGKYTWKQGQVYKGQFQKGFRQGYGFFKDQHGNQFRGIFQKQQAIGKCQITFINQDSYSGLIEKGRFEGKGTLILYEEEEIWKGQWVEDIFFEDQKGKLS